MQYSVLSKRRFGRTRSKRLLTTTTISTSASCTLPSLSISLDNCRLCRPRTSEGNEARWFRSVALRLDLALCDLTIATTFEDDESEGSRGRLGMLKGCLRAHTSITTTLHVFPFPSLAFSPLAQCAWPLLLGGV
ncbi:hypothetical protein OH76DRAFT_109872 [Lentinus brumalis]|uniref:Uncharacterized protein n=1 Tax=Lentinus brumalis TaxID=2498619 RepID=A0A371CPY2_9APHY|nr:hypothetical protein OH76DRAFT_109872 [Polyporus brumalis]